MPLASDDQEGPGSLERGMEESPVQVGEHSDRPRQRVGIWRVPRTASSNGLIRATEVMWQSVRNAAPRLAAASIRSRAQWQTTEPESVNVFPCSGMNW
jgi:hypothetical protein